MLSKEITRHVKELVDQNQKEKAVDFVFDLIEKYIEKKQFNKAEKLRELLIKIDPMALTKIIHSAEMIEGAKAKLIDGYHKSLWANLYNSITDEEANAFYFALKKAVLQPGKTLMQQGRLNNKLFFIEQGVLKLVYSKKGYEFFLKNISKGEMLGQDSFFSASVATITAISMDQIKLYFLERKKYLQLVDQYPGFDRKLENFARAMAKDEIKDILEKKNIERRDHQRFKASGKVGVQVIGAGGGAENLPFYAILEDVSETGLAMTITANSISMEKARFYLGKSVGLKIIFENSLQTITAKGVIVSVYNALFHDYLLGVRFFQPIPFIKIKEFIIGN